MLTIQSASSAAAATKLTTRPMGSLRLPPVWRRVSASDAQRGAAPVSAAREPGLTHLRRRLAHIDRRLERLVRSLLHRRSDVLVGALPQNDGKEPGAAAGLLPAADGVAELVHRRLRGLSLCAGLLHRLLQQLRHALLRFLRCLLLLIEVLPQ